MSHSAYSSAPSPDVAHASRIALAPRILRLADGDPVFAAQIREMMWGEYGEAGAPLGRSEEGMMVWWEGQLGPQPV